MPRNIKERAARFYRRHVREDLDHWRRRLARRIRPSLRLRGVAYFLGAVLMAVLAAFALSQSGLPREAVLMTGIFVLAALLWVTEALPLFATAILVMGLEIVLLANPGGWRGLGFEQGPSPGYRTFLDPLSDPVIVLFLGGFLMAQAAIKEGVDHALAGVILRLFRGRPRSVMMGLMLVTAGLSMFMSNTATTAMMITLVAPMLAQIPPGDPVRKGLVLSVPFAANIGGMGTPISSPPNAVAVGFLEQAGYEIAFLEWMLIAVPLAGILLLVSWALLWRLFRTRVPNLHLEPVKRRIDGRGWFVLAVMALTIGLWLTDQLHGLPTAVVALVPAVAFTATGLLGRRDYNSLEWHILTLIAGGIALGVGVQATGLDRIIVEAIPLEGRFAVGVMVGATILFSTFMSNTAAANLLLPIGISLAAAGAAGVEPASGGPGALQLGISIALAASVAMALPVSTPPNAIAYAQGEFETRDLALAGSIIAALATALIVAFGGPVINFWMGR